MSTDIDSTGSGIPANGYVKLLYAPALLVTIFSVFAFTVPAAVTSASENYLLKAKNRVFIRSYFGTEKNKLIELPELDKLNCC